MHPFTLLLSVTGALAAPIVTLASMSAAVLPNKYIVTLKPGLTTASIHATHLARRADSIDKVFEVPGFAGYSGEFDATALEELMADDSVFSIEPVSTDWHTTYITSSSSGPYDTHSTKQKRLAAAVQEDAPWGLGSISHRTPNHTDYLYDSNAGIDTWAYVVDTGLYVEHEAFAGGKGVLGYNAYPNSDFEDKVGHGTHCAGTIVSEMWGVAKRAGVVSVRVFDTAGSSTEIVMDGYQWAVNDIVAKGIENSAVISMSLSGPTSTAFNTMVSTAHSLGITTVVAAGNNYADASTRSPASEPLAITVAAIDVTNIKPSFSNYGSLVDVFAPGVDVESAWIGGPGMVNTISGTSMATPHVAGLVLYWQSVYGGSGTEGIVEWIGEMGTKGVVGSLGAGSPDLLAFNGAVI